MTLSVPATTTTRARTAADALEAGIDHLRARQDAAGWWKGDLDTNVTMDAEDLLLRHVLGISDPERTAGAARWIRSQQRADGTWATFAGGPGDLSTTVEAWVALRLAGDDAASDHMAAAAAFVREQGGVERTRVFTRIWLALFGLWSWDDLPAMPPELIHLPHWFPLNVSDWACWARQTVVPLTVVSTLRPSHPVDFDIEELRVRRPGRGVRPGLDLGGLLPAPRRRAARLRPRGPSRTRWPSSAAARCARPASGSSPARRPTAGGAASSRRGCTR